MDYRCCAALCVLAGSLWACAPAGATTPERPPTAVTAPAAANVPTLDASAFAPGNARAVSVQAIDTDSDGVPEWLVLYSDALTGAGRGMIVRHERGADVVYFLGGRQPATLYQDRLLSQTVKDINGDGKPEIMLEGALGEGRSVVNVFQWNGADYANLLSLTGPEGVAIDDPQQNGVLDFTAAQALFRRSAIIRATHAEWNGNAYRTSNDVLFLFGSPASLDQPESAALAYYVYWGRRQPDAMQSLMSADLTAATPRESLDALTRDAESVRVDDMKLDAESADAAQVTVEARIVRHGDAMERAETDAWRLTRAAGGPWQLAGHVQQ